MEPITNVYRHEDEITQETPMKFEDRPEPYTPISHPVDGNDNQITDNSDRKTIDHKMTKKGICRIQKLGMIFLGCHSSCFLYLYLNISFRR